MARQHQRAFDAITVAECAYDLRSSKVEWLARLRHLIAPAIEQDRGVFVAELEVSGTPHQAWSASPKTWVGQESYDYFERVCSNLRPELIAPLLVYAPSVDTLQGLVKRKRVDSAVMEEADRATGAADIFTLMAWTPGHTRGLALVAPSSKPCVIPLATIKRWQRVMSHLAAGYRLRCALEAEPQQVEAPKGGALLDPHGKVLHANGDATERSALTALSKAARAIDRARGSSRRSADALETWTPMVTGRWSLIDQFDRDGRRFVVAHVNADRQLDPRALSAGERRVATRLARGDSQKEIAYELGVSPSTVGTHVVNIGRKLGTSSQWETTSLLTTLLKQPAKLLSVEGMELRVWSEPSQSAPVELTESEADVYQALLSGASNAQIARKRGTSPNTVANQVAAIFSKLGVSSRQELLGSRAGKARARSK
ncbi:MAG: LuxR family transcriptional regulator [Polyangiaceae bacterium]|nr:LuxR family transcriptional regulator [Myxococcales bacterium]MCB9587939.1 LuxR family transcriptional regulator [Polyangiaceae bacterium]